MVIEILEGSEKPYYLKEKGPKPSGVFKRLGRSCRQASEDEILSMLMDSKGYFYEKDISEEQELTFKYFFSICDEQKLNHQKRNLVSLGILNKNHLYTNLGLLLSDQSPIIVKVAKYDKNMNFLLKREFKGSLLKTLNDVIDIATVNNDISAKIDVNSFKRIETISYPGASLREGILNAFCHADYFIRSNIKIEFFPKELKITNPGGIYKATLEDILNGIQTYRNPGLVNILNKLGYIENFGSGIPRIINSYKESDFEPLFRPSENFFSLVLPSLNTVNDLLNDSLNDPLNDLLNDSLNKRLSDFDLLVLKSIKDNPGLNAKQLLDIVSILDKTATLNRIKNTIKRNLVDLCEFRGSRRSGGYHFKSFKN
ncbi:MAG: ATP-binding protein [Sharpea porci]|uniref:ATP-binding protein n=1 Tax=Sharpea porci TaxID=2652286 RepID=UPI002409D39D|nr:MULTISPECIES: ATP-binding protein [Coprobacillaceae]MDD6596603.1 ATP-binding protein [Catenibacterium mitsuokai]MDD6710546.1 ATP-binding protein [Sharpea porci]